MTSREATPRVRRRVEVTSAPIEELDVALIAVLVRKGQAPEGVVAEVDGWLSGSLARALDTGLFAAESGDVQLFPGQEPGRPHVLAVGIRETAEVEVDDLRRAAGLAVREAGRRGLASVALLLPGLPATGVGRLIQEVAEGAVLGDWTLEEFKTTGEDFRVAAPGLVRLWLPPAAVETGAADAGPADTGVADADRGRILAEAQNAARELVARPPNVVTPRYLAASAERLGADFGLRVECWGPERLREEGFGALLAVARGSVEEPRLLILEHEGEGGPPYVIVGKGVTFDSGGISLKPAKGMEEMKYDMAGSAAVLGLMRAAAELRLPQRIIGLIVTTENLPSGRALKPSDVIRGVAGTSIEVVNTDAEGRLILSDALAFGARLRPVAMVDLATLTGGCVVALGHHAIGLMSNDDALAEAIISAGERSAERCWRLPLWDVYRRQLDSDIADIKNSGGRDASAITGGRFLQEFVDDVPWVHLDIAGTAWAEEASAYQPKGATGVGVRLLAEWLLASG